jgi:hypothetical protein
MLRPSPSIAKRRRSASTVDNVIIAIGQRAALKWLPDEFKTERGTIKIDASAASATRTFLPRATSCNWASGQPLMVVNAVGDGKRVAFNLDKVMRGESLQPRTIPIDVIFDLNRMNMTYFPHFPRVQQEMLPPTSAAEDAAGSDSGVHRRAGGRGGRTLLQLRHLQRLRQLLPGLSGALHRAPGAVERAV